MINGKVPGKSDIGKGNGYTLKNLWSTELQNNHLARRYGAEDKIAVEASEKIVVKAILIICVSLRRAD